MPQSTTLGLLVRSGLAFRRSRAPLHRNNHVLLIFMYVFKSDGRCRLLGLNSVERARRFSSARSFALRSVVRKARSLLADAASATLSLRALAQRGQHKIFVQSVVQVARSPLLPHFFVPVSILDLL